MFPLLFVLCNVVHYSLYLFSCCKSIKYQKQNILWSPDSPIYKSTHNNLPISYNTTMQKLLEACITVKVWCFQSRNCVVVSSVFYFCFRFFFVFKFYFFVWFVLRFWCWKFFCFCYKAVELLIWSELWYHWSFEGEIQLHCRNGWVDRNLHRFFFILNCTLYHNGSTVWRGMFSM